MNREIKHQNMKAHIVTSIFLSLEQTDFKDLTSEQIADSAQVSKRTLYKYFKSKDEMYLALIHKSFMELNEAFEEALVAEHMYHKSRGYYETANEDDTEFLKKVILTLGKAYLDFMLNNPLKGHMVVNYNEMDFKQDNKEGVEEVAEVANIFELTKIVFSDKNEGENKDEVTDKQLHIDNEVAIYCWSSIQGFANLLMNKESWMTDYYKSNREELINQYLKVTEKVIGGLLNEKY